MVIQRNTNQVINRHLTTNIGAKIKIKIGNEAKTIRVLVNTHQVPKGNSSVSKLMKL